MIRHKPPFLTKLVLECSRQTFTTRTVYYRVFQGFSKGSPQFLVEVAFFSKRPCVPQVSSLPHKRPCGARPTGGYSLPTSISTILRCTPPAICTPVGPARFAPEKSIPLYTQLVFYTPAIYTKKLRF